MMRRCPDCQTEVEDGAEVCPSCFAVLPASGRSGDPMNLWRPEVSKPEILTSARNTGDVPPAEAAAAVARARAARRAPVPPTGPQSALPRPRPPTGPLPRTGLPGRGLPVTGPHQRVSRDGHQALPSSPPRLPDAGPAVTGPMPQPPEVVAASPQGRRFGPQAEIVTHLVSGDPEAQRGTQIVEISLPPAVKQARRGGEDEPGRARAQGPLAVEESKVTQGVDESIASLTLLYRRMHALDRWSLWALLLALAGGFLPWVYVRGEGLLAGIQDLGGIAAIGLCALALACLFLRTARRRFTGVLLLLQLLLTALLAATPVYAFITSVEVQLSAGPVVVIAAAATAALLAVLRLARPGG